MGNKAESTGYGGAVRVFGGPCSLVNCFIVGNHSADRGGGVAARGPMELTNCVLAANISDGAGGGLYTDYYSAVVANCTFHANSAVEVGGGFYARYQSPTVINCILWGNQDQRGSGESAQILVENGAAAIDYSNVQGWTGDLGGIGNMGIEPEFVDPDGIDGMPGTLDDNLRLSAFSFIINEGDPDYDPPPPGTDLDGHARILCDRVDMGAYEFGIGDHNCDRAVAFDDYRAWADCMTGPDGGPYEDGCEAFDFNFDGDVDLDDFVGFMAVFDGP